MSTALNIFEHANMEGFPPHQSATIQRRRQPRTSIVPLPAKTRTYQKVNFCFFLVLGIEVNCQKLFNNYLAMNQYGSIH